MTFWKYHGTGNDFILIDDRDDHVHLSQALIQQLCERRFGIGADGLIILRNFDGYDFKMTYYNADGNEGSMCGNGGRCITAFAKAIGKIVNEAFFSASDGDHRSIITAESPITVKLKMNDVQEVEVHEDFIFLDTGSPHYVKFVEDVTSVDVVSEGREIRNSSRFKKTGTNVNFVQTSGSELIVRTYERGVEDETLSCGTGVTASAIAAVVNGKLKADAGTVDILTIGGKLKVYFEKEDGGFKNIWLEGGAALVYKGEVHI
ncbi:MAG: diaminopimelate epimerase [Bacteroidetes bacterium]|nr:diaminopimelate epimerase [Bacteroidota bacterium]